MFICLPVILRVVKLAYRHLLPSYRQFLQTIVKMLFINNSLHCRVFYPRDAMLARVFATATCPNVQSVCLSVRHTPVLCLAERKQDREMYTI